MAIDLSTAGITVNYAAETTAGARPTTGYKKVSGIKSIPELNPEPETLESTTLEAIEWKTYIEGLKDLGGALAFTANLTQQLMDDWDEVLDANETAKTAGLRLWVCILIPGLEKAFFFPFTPAKMGMPSAEVNAVLEINLYMTPIGEPDWFEKPTIGEAGPGGEEPQSYSTRQATKKTTEVNV